MYLSTLNLRDLTYEMQVGSIVSAGVESSRLNSFLEFLVFFVFELIFSFLK